MPDTPELNSPASTRLFYSEERTYQDTLDLSQFGLKNSHDVLVYIRSPLGEEAISEMQKAAASEEALTAEQRQAQQENLMMKLRIHALLSMIFAHSSAKAAQRKDELIVDQIQHRLQSFKHKTDEATESSFDQQEELRKVMAHYQQSLEDLEKQRDQLIQDKQALESEKEKVAERYDQYEAELDELDEEGLDSVEEIEAKIADIELERDQEIAGIASSIESGQDEISPDQLNSCYGKHLQVAHLRNHLDVLKGNKCCIDENGEQSKSYKDAYIVHDNEQKVVKHEGKFYLLEKGQDWDEVKNDLNALNEAQDKFEEKKQDLLSPKHIVKFHKEAELKYIDQRIETINQCLIQTNLLQNQLNAAQAAVANLRVQLGNQADPANQQSSNNSSPLSIPSATNAGASRTQAFAAAINQLKSNDAQTVPSNVQNTQTAQLGTTQSANTRQNRFARGVDQNDITMISRSGYVNSGQMKFLLQALERFGVDIQKEKPTEAKHLDLHEHDTPAKKEAKQAEVRNEAPEVKQEKEEQEHTYKSPTPSPFKTDPY